MYKKILIIGLVCTFLIIYLTTTSAIIIKSEINSIETGKIICHVSDKNTTPEPEPTGLKDIKLVLKNDNGTLTLEGLTDDKGQYIFVDLLYGGYSITADGGFCYSNQTKDVILKKSFASVEFSLTKKSRVKNYLNSVLLELFQHFPVLTCLINIEIKN